MKLLPMSHDAGHSAHTCHWSVPTLLMPWPYWMSACDAPWSCWNYRDVGPLESTDICRTCSMWTPRHVTHGHALAIPPAGAVPLPRPPTPGA